MSPQQRILLNRSIVSLEEVIGDMLELKQAAGKLVDQLRRVVQELGERL